MILGRFLNLAQKMKYKIVIALFFIIIILGIIKININWTKEIMQWDTPYKDNAKSVMATAEMEYDNYVIDDAPLKIYYDNSERNNIRIDIYDYVILWNEEAIKQFKENVREGINESNSRIKDSVTNTLNKLKAMIRQ